MTKSVCLYFAGLTLFALACSDDVQPVLEVREGALGTSGIQMLFVPTYFNTDLSVPANSYSWTYVQAYNDPDDDFSTTYFAVVDPSNGPGTQYDPAVQARINQYLTNELIQVFGYVNTDPATQTMNDVITNVMRWKNLGYTGLTGIFFDVADRTGTSSTDIGRAEYLAQLARANFVDQYGQNGSVFNWGRTASNLESFVNCVGSQGRGTARNTRTWFVTEEVSEYTFTTLRPASAMAGGAEYSWLLNYSPTHFINLVHGVNPNASTVANLLHQSRQLNAANVYLTDRLFPNDPTESNLTDPAPGYPGRPWNPLAGFNVPGGSTVWSAQALAVGNHVFSDYPGGPSDIAPRATCPDPVAN